VFQFLELSGSNIEEPGQALLDKAKHDQRWTQENIRQFLSHHKDGEVNKKEIASSTLAIYISPLRLFCGMNNMNYNNWKHIAKSSTKSKMSANDQVPTIHELQMWQKWKSRQKKFSHND